MRAARPGTSRRSSRLPLDDARLAWLLLIPLLVLLVLYKYVPIAEAVRTATHDYTLAGDPLGSVGLGNFREVLGDHTFRKSLGLTLLFVLVKVPVTLVLGLGLALLLLRNSRINSIVRSGVLIPAITPVVVVGLIFLFIFDKEIGIANAVWSVFGAEGVGWLTEARSAQAVIVLVSLWRDAGFVMLVYLGGLGGIPQSILEAARVDGCSGLRLVRRVVVPLLQRSTQFATTFATIAAFQFFAPIFVMTRGGPQGSTDVASFHIYQSAFIFFDWGNANAMSLILVVLIVLVTAVELRLLRTRWEY